MYDLAKGEQMLAHPGHIGMFAGDEVSITRVKGIRNMLLATMGCSWPN